MSVLTIQFLNDDMVYSTNLHLTVIKITFYMYGTSFNWCI